MLFYVTFQKNSFIVNTPSGAHYGEYGCGKSQTNLPGSTSLIICNLWLYLSLFYFTHEVSLDQQLLFFLKLMLLEYLIKLVSR